MTRLQGALDADFINIKETPETVNLEVQMKKPNDVQGTVDAALSSGRQYGEAVGGTLFTSTKRAAVSVATGAKESVIDAPKVAAHQAQEAVANVRCVRLVDHDRRRHPPPVALAATLRPPTSKPPRPPLPTPSTAPKRLLQSQPTAFPTRRVLL